MRVSAEALGSKSGDRLLAAGADEILMPCVGALDVAIDRAARVPGPVTVHVPANRVDDAERVIERLRANGIGRALVVSGNPGHGGSPHGVHELIPQFRRHGIEVSVGAYPEDYFTVTSRAHREKSAGILAGKQAAGAQRIITQASFSVRNMRQWLQTLRSREVTLPVHVGVMVRVPRRAFAAVLRSARAEVLSHPRMRTANKASLDLFFRMLRSRVPDPAAFVREVGALYELGPGDGFHVFSYGVDASRLIAAARSMDAPGPGGGDTRAPDAPRVPAPSGGDRRL